MKLLDKDPQVAPFANNPAWIMLDVLRHIGWQENELDIESFADAAIRYERIVDDR